MINKDWILWLIRQLTYDANKNYYLTNSPKNTLPILSVRQLLTLPIWLHYHLLLILHSFFNNSKLISYC